MIAFEETTTVQPGGRVVVEHPDLKPGAPVKVIVLVDAGKTQPQIAGRRLRLDWGGALADLASQHTSVQLQHKANEWRAD